MEIIPETWFQRLYRGKMVQTKAQMTKFQEIFPPLKGQRPEYGQKCSQLTRSEVGFYPPHNCLITVHWKLAVIN